jgi:hypothetical protein
VDVDEHDVGSVQGAQGHGVFGVAHRWTHQFQRRDPGDDAGERVSKDTEGIADQEPDDEVSQIDPPPLGGDARIRRSRGCSSNEAPCAQVRSCDGPFTPRSTGCDPNDLWRPSWVVDLAVGLADRTHALGTIPNRDNRRITTVLIASVAAGDHPAVIRRLSTHSMLWASGASGRRPR